MESATEYRIERFTATDIPVIARLHRRVNGSSITEAELERKFDTGAVGGEVIGYIAFAADGSPAAYYGIFPLRVTDGERVILAAQSGNTMTHPDHQGRGLFKRLGRVTFEAAAQEGIEFVFGFPNQNSYPGLRSLGWAHIRTMRSYFLPCPTIPLDRIGARFPKLQPKIRRYRAGVLETTRLASRPDEVPSSVLAEGGAGVLRDQPFFTYKNHGDRLLSFTQSGTSVVFTIDSRLSVGDFVVEKGPTKAWLALGRLVLTAMVTGCTSIRFHTSPGSPTDEVLAGRIPVKPGLASVHLALGDAVDPEIFDYTLIDYDTY